VTSEGRSTLTSRREAIASRCQQLVGAGLLVALALCRSAAACVVDADCFSFDPCHVNVRCVNGTCLSDPKNCEDFNACTIDSCDAIRGCVHDPLCPPNGLACNPAPHCGHSVLHPQVVLCIPTLSPNCDDGNACTIDGCREPDGCYHDPVACDDGNPCTADGCDPATGCTHTPIAGCCATAADCLVDKCHARLCQATACVGSPLPIDCDDGDPDTIDACDLVTGCTHTPGPSTTTSTTLRPCVAEGDCAAPADACSVAACSGGQCGSRPVTGLDALACVCRRTDPPVCAQQPIPHRVTARRTRACAFIAKAVTGGKKTAKLATRAARFLGKARKLLAAAKQVSPACVQALGTQLADGVVRAEQAGRRH
jgi:hypothetical protein